MNRRASLFVPLAVVLLAWLAPVGVLAGDAQEARQGEESETQAPAQDAVSQAEPPEIPTEDMKEKDRVLTGSDLVDDDFPGSWPMFGRNVRMKVGGYVQANYLYDFDGSLDRRQFLMSTLPVEGTPEYDNRGYSSFFVNDSRFNVDVRRIDKDKPPLRVFLEGDFWPSGSSFRLRHAYVVFGDFLAGQTWTTLSVLEAMVIGIDFAAGDALFGGRTTQLRYQRHLGERWKLALGVENLDFMGIENPDGLGGAPSQGAPLLAARVDYSWKGGLLVVGSSVGQLRWDGGADGPYATALQWDALVAGRQYLGRDFLTWHVSYGHGSGENIMAFIGSDANAVLTPDGRLETIPAFAFVLGFHHKWSDQLASNLSYAYGWLETPETRDPLALRKGGIGHANLVWQPTDHFSTGVEYMYGAQRTSNDSLGQASRVQGMVKMEF